jgi:CubicO group peptidase (beta-lactamase class C family)
VADGLTNAGIERLHAAAERHVGDTRVPGLVALVARGAQVHVEALGSLTVGGRPVARDAIFRIASTTKPITGAATLAVAAEGLIDLDEPVERLLPELARPRVLRRMNGPLEDTVPAIRPITTRDLLSFTFGFGMVMDMFMSATPWPVVAAAEDLNLATIGPPNPDVQPDPDAWIANLGSLPLLAQPGERWLYNTGASVLGVLLARAARQPFGEVLRTRVLEPLGMHDTGFWTTHIDRLATAYRPTPEGRSACSRQARRRRCIVTSRRRLTRRSPERPSRGLQPAHDGSAACALPGFQIRQRIDRVRCRRHVPAPNPHLKMQMRRGGVAGLPGTAEHLSSRDALTGCPGE